MNLRLNAPSPILKKDLQTNLKIPGILNFKFFKKITLQKKRKTIHNNIFTFSSKSTLIYLKPILIILKWDLKNQASMAKTKKYKNIAIIMKWYYLFCILPLNHDATSLWYYLNAVSQYQPCWISLSKHVLLDVS